MRWRRGGGSGDTVRMANWPLYIEDDQTPNSGATIVESSPANTKLKVNYRKSIDDNDASPQKNEANLAKKEDIGYDLCVLDVVDGRRVGSRTVGCRDPRRASCPTSRTCSIGWPTRAGTRAASTRCRTPIGQVGIALLPREGRLRDHEVTQLLDPKLKGG